MPKAAVGVFVAFLGLYFLNGRAHPEVDCVAAPYTAWSLARHGSCDMRPYPTLRKYVGTCIQELPDGSWLSIRPPGAALATVPFVAPFAAFREEPFRDEVMHQLGKLAAAVCVAASAVFFFLVCRRLAPEAAWPATVLYGLGTSLCSVASQAIWMHGPAVLGVSCTLYCLTREDGERAAWGAAAGLALGFALLTRPTTAFFAAATGAAFLAQRRWREAAGLCAGCAIPGLILLGYNTTYFGSPFLGGYAGDNWQESPPLWVGLGGLLIAPSRGLFVYSPALLLAVPGAWLLVRTRGGEPWSPYRGLLVAWLAAAALTVAFYARWHDWRGGWCYGPRFLCETMPVLCLLFAVGYRGLRAVWSRRVAVGLVGVSVAVHLVGIFGYSGYAAWQERHHRDDQGRCLFALHDTQIEAHARAFLRKMTGRR